jgi:hypothetical protein
MKQIKDLSTGRPHAFKYLIFLLSETSVNDDEFYNLPMWN